MRTASGLLVTGLCALAAPSGTLAATRPLPAGRPATSPAVASLETAAVAYAVPPGRMAVWTPGRSLRTYAAPPHCVPEAIAPDSIVLCRGAVGSEPSTVTLEPTTGALTPLRVAMLRGVGAMQWFDPTRAGTGWIEGYVTFETAFGKATHVPVILGQATGELVDLSAAFTLQAKAWGSRRFVDLSSDPPNRPLCAPVRRPPVVPPYRTFDTADSLTKVGRWTLRNVERRYGEDPRRLLQRCGSSRSLRTGRSAQLGRGFAAWLVGRERGRVVRLRDLARGTTRSYRVPAYPALGFSDPVLAFSSDRLVVSRRARRNTWRVSAIRLR
jgi:hypothetical protein